jgi:hypothetical protein
MARSVDDETELPFRVGWTLWCDVDQPGPEVRFQVENFKYQVDRATLKRCCSLLAPPATAKG